MYHIHASQKSHQLFLSRCFVFGPWPNIFSVYVLFSFNHDTFLICLLSDLRWLKGKVVLHWLLTKIPLEVQLGSRISKQINFIPFIKKYRYKFLSRTLKAYTCQSSKYAKVSFTDSCCYQPQTKSGKGNVFTGVCPFKGAGNIKCITG